jgi:hypothetical protein
MKVSLRPLLAGVALALVLALAPAAVSARTILVSFTGIVTGGASDVLGVFGNAGDVPNGPSVSGTVTFETAGSTFTYSTPFFGQEWRHSNGVGTTQMSATFSDTPLGSLTVEIGAGTASMINVYQMVFGNLYGTFYGNAGVPEFSINPVFATVPLFNPADPNALWSASIAGGSLVQYDASLQFRWGTSDEMQYASGILTSIVLTDITAEQASVPAPASLALFGLGLAGIATLRRRAA